MIRQYSSELAMAAILASVGLAVLAGGVADAQTVPYGNESADEGRDGWTDGREEWDARNVAHYVSRVTGFFVGDVPGDPGAGPLLVGLMASGVVVSQMGTSRAGYVAGGTMGVLTAAALSGAAALLPYWAYGVVMMIVAFVCGVVYIRMVR
jgi:hypothetical protein